MPDCYKAGRIGADVETYTKCLEKSCRDASSTFLKSLTGDDMNCSTLAKRPGFTCDADLSKKFSRLPEGTTLKSICQVTCGCYYQFPPYTWRNIGGYDTSMHLTAQPTWYGGALERPPNLNKLCDPGTKYNTTTGLCEDCPSGKYTFHKGRTQCELCQAGTHSSNSRSSNCQACQKGTFSRDDGSKECSACALGYFADDIQKTQCAMCPIGTTSTAPFHTCTRCAYGHYASQTGSSACTPCPVGMRTKESGTVSLDGCLCNVRTYKPAPNSAKCNKCPDKMTTDDSIGATAESECFCPDGTVESVEGKCAKCGEGELEGLKCTGGSPKKIIVQNGFFAGIKGGTLPAEAFVGVKGKYSVFKCFNDRLMCPEGDIARATLEGRASRAKNVNK